MSFLSEPAMTSQWQTAAAQGIPSQAKQYIHSFMYAFIHPFYLNHQIIIDYLPLLGILVGPGQREKQVSPLVAPPFLWEDRQ